MPFSKKLEEEYKGKKIVFIYISLDAEAQRWKIASISEKLNVQNSFLLADTKNSYFIKQRGEDNEHECALRR